MSRKISSPASSVAGCGKRAKVHERSDRWPVLRRDLT
jgi:hypothetical protein